MFTVRVPFLVPAFSRISEELGEKTEAHLTFALSYEGYYHVVKAHGFVSQEEAQAFVASLPAAFAWLLLEKHIAADYFVEPQTVKYSDRPEQLGANLSHSVGGVTAFGPVDVFLDGAQAAVYLTEKRVKFLTGFPATLSTSIRAGSALDALIQGCGHPRSAEVAADAKLMVALSQYAAHFTETSGKAKYLTLIMALESLSMPTAKAPLALRLLDRWKVDAYEALKAVKPDTEDALAVQALQRELLFRWDDSIRSQVRKLVLDTLSAFPDATEKAREALRLYDLRSILTHEGEVEQSVLDDALSKARELVQQVLRARYERRAGQVAQ